MSIHKVDRGSTGSRWLGAVSLMLTIEAALGLLFLAEAMAFSWFGSPIVTPDAVVGASVINVSVSPDGARGVSVWRIRYGSYEEALKCTAMFHPMQAPERAAFAPFKHRQPIRVAYSPVGDLAAIGCDDGSLYLFRPGDKRPTPRLLRRNPRSRIIQIAFSPDGQLLLCLDNSSIRAWSIASNIPIGSLPRGPEAFCCFAFIPGTQRVLLGNEAGLLYMWSMTELSSPKIFASCGNSIRYLACSRNGRRAVACGVGGALHAWDLDSKKLLWRQPPVNGSSISPTVFAADSETIISGFAHTEAGGNRSVALIVRNAETGATVRVLAGHTHEVTTLAIAGDNLLYSGSRDGTIRTWDLLTGKEMRRSIAADLLEACRVGK